MPPWRRDAVTDPAARLVCAGCGEIPATTDTPALAFRCPAAQAGDDVDHVLRRVLDPRQVDYPREVDPNPFLRYRGLLYSYHLARAGGLGEAGYRALVEELDRAVERVGGRPIRTTPMAPADELAQRLGLEAGQLWVKNETGNVAGSHKARHLFGLLLDLLVAQLLTPSARLAIASCGNAALAAAVLARAVGRPLEVFVPPWADPKVVGRLEELAARVTPCPRSPGVVGDPCYHRFRQSVLQGAIPFCCQGPDNGLTIEGGSTLAWEIVDTLGARTLDRIFVQVGGGALASACAHGFADAVRLGRLARAPRLHAVQARGCHPLARSYAKVVESIVSRLSPAARAAARQANAEQLADLILEQAGANGIERALRSAADHRSACMSPWESEPKSVATGILDDETYDWLAVVEAMLRTGGWPVVVDEATLIEANGLGCATTGIEADATGTAGLAGWMHELAAGVRTRGETIAVLFTGARRGATA